MEPRQYVELFDMSFSCRTYFTAKYEIHEEDLKQTRRDRPVYKKKLGNYNKCECSNFFLFQWPKMIISVLVTWMIVDCNLAVRVVLSF